MKRKERRKKKYRYMLILFAFLIFIFGAVLILSTKSKQKQNEKPNKISLHSGKTKEKKPESKTSLFSKTENHLPILMFHYVTSRPDELPQDSNNISIDVFENELKTLKQNKYKTVTAKEAQRLLTTREKPGNKLVWLTFDDGSITMYTEIFPLLKKYNMHATSFIITDFVNNGQGGILNWNQIKEMKDSGLVDFGSHTADHFDLGIQTDELQKQELLKSKSDLDKHLKQNTNMICYPAGGYNKDTLDIAKDLGYKFGFLDPGRNGAEEGDAKESDGLLTLPRYRMLDTTTASDVVKKLEEATNFNVENTVRS